MKLKFKSIIFLLLTVVLFSCSENSDPTPAPVVIESLTLSADLPEVEVGQKITLSVVANTDENLTNKASFFVNNKKITSNSFTPEEVGSYQITATYNDITSNAISLKVNKVSPKAITLSVNSKQISKGETITISIITDTNEDVSAEAQIYVNDALIEGVEFTPDASGEYSIYAIYGNLSSDKVKFTVLGDIQVYLDKQQVMTGEAVTITVKDENEKNISDSAIIYVNGNKIDGLSFTPTAVGNYTVYAMLGNSNKSKDVDFYAVGTTTSFQKHPVIEAFVHAKCPYCPRIHYAIELLAKQTDAVIPIMFHPITRSTWVDVMYHEDGQSLFYDTYKLETVPNGIIDRLKITNSETGQKEWKKWSEDYKEHEQLNVVLDLVDDVVYTGLALDLNKTENQLHLTAKLNFLENFDQQLNLAVFILENNIIEDQPNKPEKGFYGGANPIVDFVHNNVYKGSFTGVWGEQIPSESTMANNIYIKEFSLDIPESVTNSNEITVVAIITDVNSKAIINARSIKLGGEKQQFEFK